MSLYSYRALDVKGRIVKGEREAINEWDLEAGLRKAGLVLVTARVVRQRGGVRQKSLSRRELIDFFFYLEMLVQAGVPVVDVLRDLGETTGTSSVRMAATTTADAIVKGETLTNALAATRAIPEEFVRLIAAGELSGNLPVVLHEIVRSLKWRDELASRTKRALMYPSFALVAIAGAVIFLMSYLVPQLVSFIINMGQEPPLHTRALIAVSDFMSKWWYLVFSAPVAVGLLLFVIARFNRDFRAFLHGRMLEIPALGPLFKKLILARLVDVLALMYRSGIPILDALAQAAEAVTNLAVRDAVQRVRQTVVEGTPLSEAFAREALFPPLVVRMLRVGENTGALDEALGNVSYFYMRDIDEAVNKLQSMIEPVLTVVLALLLGWIMLSVLGPIYDTISKLEY